MSLAIVPNSFPSFTALSTDIVNGKIPNLFSIGSKVYITDTGDVYVVGTDYSLIEYKGDPVSVENEILVQSPSITIVKTPTLSLTQYVANDCVGGLMELENCSRSANGPTFVGSVMIIDKSAQNLSTSNLILFNAAPVGTYTDNAAVVMTDDIDKIIGIYQLAGQCSITNISMLNLKITEWVTCDANKKLYAAVIAGGNMTFTSTSALSFKWKVCQM